MTERNPLLTSLVQPVTLQSGITVQIRAWSLLHVEQHTTDFFAFLRFFVQGIRGQDLDTQPRAMGLLGRVAHASLVDPADTEQLTVADLPVLAQAIFDLNRLGDVAGGLLGLLTHAQQAVAEASEQAGNPPSPTSPPNSEPTRP